MRLKIVLTLCGWLLTCAAGAAQGILQPGQVIGNSGAAAAQPGATYGLSWVDPRNFGVVIDGVTDTTTAFNALEATSNINIKWPPGTVCVNGGGVISGNFVRNTGAANQTTVIKNCGSTNNTLLTVTGGFPVIEHMQILGLNNKSSTHPTIYLNGATHCVLDDLTVYYGYYSIQNNSADCHMIDVVASYSFQANFYSNNGAFYVLRTSFDSPQPYGTIPSSTAAWSSSAPVAANAVLTVSGIPLQYSASCTTGGSAPTVVGYGLNITDGTCTAQIAGPLYLAYFDSGASVNYVDASDFSGFSLNASVYSVSSSLSISNSTVSGYGYGVELNGGDQITLDNVSISFAESGANGLLATASFTGDLSVTNGMFNNSPGSGLFLQGGATINLANNRSSNLSAGGYGLSVSGATHVLSVNNNWGGTTANPGGIDLGSTTDYFQSIGDDLKNAGTKITNTSSGTHNLICFTAGVASTCNTLPTGVTWPVSQGGTNCTSASITCFNNITGFTASGTTGTTSTNLVFSTSPTFAGTVTFPDGGTFTSSADNFAAATTVTSASFGLTGTISASGIFGTSGIRYKNVAATLTDTGSSGTIAANYDSLFGGSTLTASSATTLTQEFGSYFKAPTCSTNVTCSSSFALGADSIFVGGGVSINQNATATVPTTALYTQGNGTKLWGADSSNTGYNGMTFGGVVINGFVRFDGTAASPTALQSGDEIGRLVFGGAESSSVVDGNRARINVFAAETWTSSANGTYASIFLTAKTTKTTQEDFRFQASGGLSVGNANIATDGGAGIIVGTGFQAGASPGLTQTCTVNQAKTLVFTLGILTGGSCNT